MMSILQNRDDPLTEAQGRYKLCIGTQAETQGVMSWCAPMPRFWRYDVDAAGDHHTAYFVTRSEEGDR